MTGDSRNAVWVSYSSMSEYLRCPRAYYLHYVYRDPHSRRRITLMSPPLALGQVVHEVVEQLSVLPTEARLEVGLKDRFDVAWKKVSGKSGGFENTQGERRFKERGYAMLARIEASPGPITRLAVRLKTDLPYFWLAEPEQIILCGRIDWLEYLPDQDAVRIIDFKTSTKEEPAESLQLPSYFLLASACQKRPVVGAAYWYLEFDDAPVEQRLPDKDESRENILKIAKEMKLARKLNRMECKQVNGCIACKPYEAIVAGEATMVGVNDRNQEVYMLPQLTETHDLSEVL